jgi:Tol biopolymer transport system component
MRINFLKYLLFIFLFLFVISVIGFMAVPAYYMNLNCFLASVFPGRVEDVSINMEKAKIKGNIFFLSDRNYKESIHYKVFAAHDYSIDQVMEGFGGYCAISKDAKRGLFYDYRNKKGFKIVDLSTSKTVREIFCQLESEDDDVNDYDWSPDGTKVAVSVSRSLPGQGPVWNLYVLDVDTGNFAKITDFMIPKTLGLHYPRWSPDGKKILFAYPKFFDKEFPSGIYTINLDGSEMTELLGNDMSNGFDPGWSNDGQSVVFMSYPDEDMSSQIFVLNLNTRKITMLTHDDMRKNQPVFSPDDKQVCFVGMPRGVGLYTGSQLFVVNVDKTGFAKVTDADKTIRDQYVSDQLPIWRK